MSGYLHDLKDLYWAHHEAFRLAGAAAMFFAAQLLILLWTLRRLRELTLIRERMSRLADGLALLTDTTEAGMAAIVQQLEQARKVKAVRPASRAGIARRVVTAARNGERLSQIAETEALSESEVRLHLALADRVSDADALPPLAS